MQLRPYYLAYEPLALHINDTSLQAVDTARNDNNISLLTAKTDQTPS